MAEAAPRAHSEAHRNPRSAQQGVVSSSVVPARVRETMQVAEEEEGAEGSRGSSLDGKVGREVARGVSEVVAPVVLGRRCAVGLQMLDRALLYIREGDLPCSVRSVVREARGAWIAFQLTGVY